MRVALVYEEFRLDRSLARDRVALARGLIAQGVDVHVYCNPLERRADVDGVVFHDVSPAVSRGRTRVGRALEYGAFGTAATRMLRAEESSYDIVDVAGTTAWEHDVIRAHAVQKAERRRWPASGGRTYKLPHARAQFAPLAQPRIGIAELIERLQYRPGHFERVLAVTDGVKADLCMFRAVDPDLIEVVPYPVETHQFATAEPGMLRAMLGFRHDELIALFIGHDFDRKGLVQAIHGVAMCEHDMHLVVVGDGNTSPYEKLAVELGIGGLVHFVGGTDHPETFFADAGVLLAPTYQDVWGISTVEAMAAGVPVIVSRHAGVADAVERADAGIVIEGSHGDVSDALRIVFGNLDRARAMGERGRAAATRFDVESVTRQVIAAYERVLASRRRV